MTGGAGDPTSGSGPAATFRLVTYNVRDLRGDRAAVARVLRRVRPDLACLQEAPRRPGTLHRTARLTRVTGLSSATRERGSGGTAVLVSPRLTVVQAGTYRLPVGHWWTRRRGYVVVRLRLAGGAELTVASVHLPLHPADRVEHVGEIRRRLRAMTGPVVVAGDLNEPPGGPAWAAFADVCRDVVATNPGNPAVVDTPTFPARAPRHRIDAVLVSPQIRPLSLRAAGEVDGLTRDDLVAASDHLPLVADLALGQPG